MGAYMNLNFLSLLLGLLWLTSPTLALADSYRSYDEEEDTKESPLYVGSEIWQWFNRTLGLTASVLAQAGVLPNSTTGSI